jgi:hypothetical protein
MNNQQNVLPQTYPQPLRLYHPSTSGRGAAMQLEPRFSHDQEARYNCFFLELAAQQTPPRHVEGQRVHATFNWQDKLAVKLDFTDICELLTVLEGRAENAGGTRGGIFHQNSVANTIIKFQRADQGGYMLGLSRKEMASGQAARVSIVLSEAEALGLRHILQSSLFFLCFHQHLFRCWTAHAE